MLAFHFLLFFRCVIFFFIFECTGHWAPIQLYNCRWTQTLATIGPQLSALIWVNQNMKKQEKLANWFWEVDYECPSSPHFPLSQHARSHIRLADCLSFAAFSVRDCFSWFAPRRGNQLDREESSSSRTIDTEPPSGLIKRSEIIDDSRAENGYRSPPPARPSADSRDKWRIHFLSVKLTNK